MCLCLSYMQSLQLTSRPNTISALVPFREPTNITGPSHFLTLLGKCFNLIENAYLYQLCPFFNITQHEQTWRWNAFEGILGVWKHWSIVNNTYIAMIMNDGDLCPGGVRRQTKVYFSCAFEEKLVSVREPSTCQYEAELKTPLACPVDSFLVYPSLSVEHQASWQEIERSLYYEEITEQGYYKLRHKLFVRAGLMVNDVENSHHVNVKTKISVNESIFISLLECSKAFNDLYKKCQHKDQPVERSETMSMATSPYLEISTKPSHNSNSPRSDHSTIT
ncbi:N-acetylglucosamine-1-phosphotransferase subunit gamma-like isoform X2 [Xenia sp. Carnegie-2017]|uniref:N-acetylglucosamine-1-phosphotransferase subunit gamma-like isoform X2 n=1 Tax=Xenia sp. Carnegie-2017 TaxID=2897299 RepID=UPI001F043A77|nr:N-acetylglucosamine-1-phosphotransferase subunit gamma-like isoform X2 [Xenia sp. Carnegie-2017]